MFISAELHRALLSLRGTNESIAVILPVYNEQKRIRKSMDRLISYFNGNGWDYKLIFVDDRSTDSTTSIINEYCQKEKNVEILIPPVHLGKGGSIIYAATTLDSSTKKYLAYMDSDLAADPSELERLFEHIKDYDIVIGSRILRGELGPISRPIYRSLFSSLYSRLFRTLFRMPIKDPQCGLKLFKSDVISSLFEDIKTLGFAFDTELIVTAFSQRLKIKEVPIEWVHGSSSKLNLLAEIRKMGIDLLSIWYYYHLSWQKDKICYPQKKGSIFGRLLFDLLSLSSNLKTRHSRPKFNTPTDADLSPKILADM